MLLKESYIHVFADPLGHQGLCHIALIERDRFPTVVVCTKVQDNQGPSVTRNKSQCRSTG